MIQSVRSAECALAGAKQESCTLRQRNGSAPSDVLYAAERACAKFSAEAGLVASATGPLSQGDRQKLSDASAQCESLANSWFPKGPTAGPANAVAADAAAAAALRCCANLIERIAACGDAATPESNRVARASCDPVLAVVSNMVRSRPAFCQGDALEEALEAFLARRFALHSSTSDAGEFEMVRELARSMVARRPRADWRLPASLGASDRAVRWRVAAFVGTVDGATAADQCARRMEQDFGDLAAVCCGCVRFELALTVLSAVSLCVTIAGNAPAETIRLGAAVLSSRVADRYCWGTFGAETVDFTFSETSVAGAGVPLTLGDAPLRARVTGEVTDEEEEESAKRWTPLRRRAPHDRTEDRYDARLDPDDEQRVTACADRAAAKRWTCFALATAKSAVQLAIDVVETMPPDDTRALASCVLVVALMAERGMEATADAAERIRSGCLLDLDVGKRERCMRDMTGRLVRAAVERLARAGAPQEKAPAPVVSEGYWQNAREWLARAADACRDRPAWLLTAASCFPTTRAALAKCCAGASDCAALATFAASSPETASTFAWQLRLGAVDEASVAVALTLDCAAWAAVVSGDATIDGKTDGEEEEDDEDDEVARPMLFWNWEATFAEDTTDDPCETAIACARATAGGCDAAWTEQIERQFAAILLGMCPAADVVVSPTSPALAAMHGGGASAGPKAAFGIARAARPRLTCALRFAAGWVLAQTGWHAIAEALEIDAVTAAALRTVMLKSAPRAAQPCLSAPPTLPPQPVSPGSFLGAIYSSVVATAAHPLGIVSDFLRMKDLENNKDESEGCADGPRDYEREIVRATRTVQRLTGTRCPRLRRRAPRKDLKSLGASDAFVRFCQLLSAESGEGVALPSLDCVAECEVGGPSYVAMVAIALARRPAVEVAAAIERAVKVSLDLREGSKVVAVAAATRTVVLSVIGKFDIRLRGDESDDSVFSSSSSPLDRLGLLRVADAGDAVPFVCGAEAHLAVRRILAMLSEGRCASGGADAAVLCACMAEAMKSLTDFCTVSAAFEAVRNECERAAQKDASPRVRVVLAGCLVLCAAVRLGVRASGVARARRGARDLAECLQVLEVAVKNAIEMHWDEEEKEGSVAARLLASATAVSCTAAGTACESALYVLHAKRMKGRTGRAAATATTTTTPATEEDGGADVSDTAAALDALRSLAGPLATLMKLRVANEGLDPDSAADCALNLCRMWFEPELTPWPLAESLRVRRELRVAYKIDKRTRDVLCDAALGLLAKDGVEGCPRYEKLKVFLRALKNGV